MSNDPFDGEEFDDDYEDDEQTDYECQDSGDYEDHDDDGEESEYDEWRTADDAQRYADIKSTLDSLK